MDFRKTIKSGFKLKLFFLKNMPMGFISGMRVEEMDDAHAVVSVPFNYLTKNPFRSVYFAVQAMAAELSSGVLAMDAVMKAPQPVSMLVLESHSHFTKKARSKIVFTCDNGEDIRGAVKKALETGEGQTIEVKSVGIDKEGDTVAEFSFIWTFKAK